MSNIATIRMREADAIGAGSFAPDGAIRPDAEEIRDESELQDEAFGFAFFPEDSVNMSIRDREPGCDEFGDEAHCEVEIGHEYVAYLERALDEADAAAVRAERRLDRIGPPAGGPGVADADAVMRLDAARDAVHDFHGAAGAVVWQTGVSGDLAKRHSRMVNRLQECVRRIERCDSKYAGFGVIA